MTEHAHQQVEPLWGVTQEGAPAVLALLRQQVTRYANVPVDPETEEPEAGEPAAPLALDDLPSQVRQLVVRYEKAHRTDLELIRLLSVGGTGAAGVPFTDADIPADSELVLLVLTETEASHRSVEVRSQVVLARRKAR